MRPRCGARLLLAGVLATAAPPGARADETERAWEWLQSGSFEDAAPKPAPGLTPEEASAGFVAVRSAVTFALVPAATEPPAGTADAAGFLASEDGLALGPWTLLSRARDAGPWLYGRTFDGPWVRAFVLGGSWASETGVVRLATRRRDLAPLPLAPLQRDAPGKRHLTLGTALGRRHVVAAATIESAEWFDPAAVGGRAELKSSAGRTLGKGAFALSLRLSAGVATGVGEGTAVLSPDGRCVAVVTRAAGARPPVVRPVDLSRVLLEVLAAEGRLDPPDLGLRFEPAPSAEGAPARLPPDLERLRAGRKERGGAVVGVVANKSPVLGTIWPGDLVLEIEGRPVFGDVPESVVAALEAMPLEAAVDVVLWRGGKREGVQVRALRGRSIYGDFQAEHDARGGVRGPPGR